MNDRIKVIGYSKYYSYRDPKIVYIYYYQHIYIEESTNNHIYVYYKKHFIPN